MDYTKTRFVSAMVLLGLLIIMATLDFTAAQAGICYGGLGDNLPKPSEVVALCNQHNIKRMRIYYPDQPILKALGGSKIELILGVPNEQLQSVAASQANANTWVQNYVQAFPTVLFRYIAVGNEVSPLNSGSSQYVQFVLPALQNIQTAITSAGLGKIRVSTAIETGLLGNTYPPANGSFRSDVASYINPIIGFLVKNRAPLLANIYPYFSYINNKAQIDLGYALFTSTNGVVAGGVKYQNLFYALLDSVYAALEKSGGSSLEIVMSESGWPSDGGDSARDDYARTYYTNLIQRAKNGTPKRPNRAIETYVFAMFDEDQKSPDIEKHFGIFLPNKQPKYTLTF